MIMTTTEDLKIGTDAQAEQEREDAEVREDGKPSSRPQNDPSNPEAEATDNSHVRPATEEETRPGTPQKQRKNK